MIDEYDEITNVLEEISRRLNNDNIFVSGSAAEYGDYVDRFPISNAFMLGSFGWKYNVNEKMGKV